MITGRTKIHRRKKLFAVHDHYDAKQNHEHDLLKSSPEFEMFVFLHAKEVIATSGGAF